jgi:serine/threonine protein kinase
LPLDQSDPAEIAGYVLRARLGSGGMGSVYLSFTRGGRPVAIKVVRKEFADDPEFRRRFRQEVTVAQRVQGMYTAPVLDADPEAPIPWLATAYIAGPSLAQAVAEHGPFPMFSVYRLLGGVAEGLASIHGAGLVHRDLKPANVLLAEDGPRVIDFGIAHAADSSGITGTGAIIGTPAFMAPEQVSGRPVSPATDVFALAHLAVYAATGHTVFGDGHYAALVYRIANQEPNLGDCPADLRPLLARCLGKSPEARPGLGEVMEFAQQKLSGQTFGLVGSSWLPAPVASNLPAYETSLTPSGSGPAAPAAPRPATGPSLATGPSVPAAVPGMTPGAHPSFPSVPAAAPGAHPSFPSVPGAVPAAAMAQGGYSPEPGYTQERAGMQGAGTPGFPQGPGGPLGPGASQAAGMPAQPQTQTAAAFHQPGRPGGGPPPAGAGGPGGTPGPRRRRLRPVVLVPVVILALALVGGGVYLGRQSASNAGNATPLTTTAPAGQAPAATPAATATAPAASVTPSAATATTPAAQPTGTATASQGTAAPGVSSTTYTTTAPFPLCDPNGAQWKLVNLTPGSCGQNMTPSAQGQGNMYGTTTAFPAGGPALTASNTVTVSGVVGNGGARYCLGAAEGNTASGYIGEVCASGDWYIYSVVGLGTGGPVVGKQLATGTYPYNYSTSYDISLTFGSGTGKLTITFTQGSANPLTQSFSTGQFTPTAVGYAETAGYQGDQPATIAGFTYAAG